MVIQHNIAALNSHRNMGINNSQTSKNLEKLSSGYRINKAGDDAAGLAISEKMRGQIRGLDMAENNAENGISLIQTAEGGLQEVHSILQRMRELSVQSSNGTYQDDVDRENLDLEFQALKGEIDRIADYTHYNGIKLLDGNLTSNSSAKANGLGALTFQIGANGSADQQIVMEVVDMHTSQLGSYKLSAATKGEVQIPASSVLAPDTSKVAGTDTNLTGANAKVKNASVYDLNISKIDNANNAVDVLDSAINMVSTQRAALGATQNRLEYTLNNLGVTKENLTSAESTIRDVDMAEEMMDFTKNQILVQASQAMLAQANQLPQGVLNLLR